MASKNLEYALKYHNMGWNVVPVRSDKKPLIKWKDFQQRQSTTEEINEWFTLWRDANIAVLTGSISKIVVVDIDSPKGLENLLVKVNKKDLETLRSQTGRGGTHLFYRTSKQLPNAVGILPGVDFRAEGGYVVVPPSIHANGKTYKWINKVKILELPDKIARLLSTSGKTGITEESWEMNIEKGERNNELTRRAGKLIRSRLPKPEVLKILIGWNSEHCKPPLPERDIKIIVNSIFEREGAQETQETPKDVKETPREGSEEPSGYFRVSTFHEMQEEYSSSETLWTIEDWLPSETIGMVIAAPGQYKTWLLMDLAISIATGKPFLNQYPVSETGPVLIIQQEDPFGMLLSRLGAISSIGEVTQKDDDHIVPLPPDVSNIYWHPDRLLNFKDSRSLNGLRSAIETYHPKLVILDPLYSAADSKDYMAEDAQAMLSLKKMRDTYGCSFMIAHHTVKRKELDDRENLWGSQFLNAWLESGWQLRPAKSGPCSIRIKRHFKGTPPFESITAKFDINPFRVGIRVNDPKLNLERELLGYLKLNLENAGDKNSE